jgi:hypothetical protein
MASGLGDHSDYLERGLQKKPSVNAGSGNLSPQERAYQEQLQAYQKQVEEV